MASSPHEASQRVPDDGARDGLQNRRLTGEAATYAKKHITEQLHAAFVDSGIKYDNSIDRFAPEIEDSCDEASLYDSKKAFVDALQCYQQDVKPKYKSQVDLDGVHTWDEVTKYAEEARDKYLGVGQTGIMKKIDQRLKTFQSAAPAIKAWLKLLPSTSIYGSVVCGGLTIILEAAVRLRKLRKETLDALEQVPLCIEKAELFMRTYGHAHVSQQVANLYVAILDALQHILTWYKRAAGLKCLSAFCRGPAYGEMLKSKMKLMDTASQAMTERATQRDQMRLKEIRHVTLQTNDQVGELKILAIEARNHLYDIFKDTELWQEALQTWKESKDTKETQLKSREKQIAGEKAEANTAARRSLLSLMSPSDDNPSQDVETVLRQMPVITLGDQDRVKVIIEHEAVQHWLPDPTSGGLLLHGNGRRHDPIEPTSIACALLIHVFTTTVSIPTIYWFCGLHLSGPSGSPLAMLQSLTCQLLCLPCCQATPDDKDRLDTTDFKKLLKLFLRLLRRTTASTPIVCILDGVSYYESRHQVDHTCKIINELASLASSDPPRVLLLLTSPTRTSAISRQPEILGNLVTAELPAYMPGFKQGVNCNSIIETAIDGVKRTAENLGNR